MFFRLDFFTLLQEKCIENVVRVFCNCLNKFFRHFEEISSSCSTFEVSNIAVCIDQKLFLTHFPRHETSKCQYLNLKTKISPKVKFPTQSREQKVLI